MQSAPQIVRFGAFELDIASRQLRKAGLRIKVQDQPLELLELLISRAGEVVTREEMQQRLWPNGTFVDFERSLNTAVKKLRIALNDPADTPRFVETVPRHGYRFIAPLLSQPVTTPEPPAPPEPPLHAGRVPAKRILVGAFVTAVIAIATIFLVWAPDRQNLPASSTGYTPIPLTSYPGFERHPSLSPDGRHVAFSWNGPGGDQYHIYVKPVGPGEPIQLTTGPGIDEYPSWSPDGSVIAFTRLSSDSAAEGRTGVFVKNAFGGVEKKVADIETPYLSGLIGQALSWSPDSKWLAAGGRFNSYGPFSIWLIPLVEGPARRLTTPPGVSVGDFCPAFSASGRELAFVRIQSWAVSDVYAVRLTEDLAPHGEPVRVTFEDTPIGSVAWMPDNRRLLLVTGMAMGFLSQLKMTEVDPLRGNAARHPQNLLFGEQATGVSVSREVLVYGRQFSDANIWRLDVDRPGTKPVPLVTSTFTDETPNYSQDGRIAFASTRSGSGEIWVAHSDGSEARQITFLGRPHTSNPRWSPTADAIVFDSRQSGAADLFVVNPDTGSVKQLTNDPADEIESQWSHDGNWIYFGSNRTGRFEIYKIGSKGGPFKQVTHGGGMAAAETRDGKWLYYSKADHVPTSLWKVPVSGGEEIKVLDGLSCSTNFVLSQKGIYFLSIGDGWNKDSIKYYEFATRKISSLTELGKRWWYGMAISRDERSILYSVVDNAGSDLMLVDNFR